MDSSFEPLPSGTILDGRYRVVRLVAEGGMSLVYEVEDQRLPGRLAAKQMRDIAADAEARRQITEQFHREAEILSRLSHPNLPRVTDSFECEYGRFLVEELVDGKTLEEKMDEATPRDEKEVVGWAVQICGALEYMHAQGLVYRDLKPSNVMLSGNTIRLIDFGIVRSFALGKSRDTVVMGTPGFAAPEQYGLHQTDPRSDLFSLGALMHHLLSGHDPSETPFVFPPLRQLNPLVSERTANMVTRALQLAADARFASAEDMRLALEGKELLPPQGERFGYPQGFKPVRHVTAALFCIGMGAMAVAAYPTAPVTCMAGLAYTPFWLWWLLTDYRRKRRRQQTSVYLDERGLVWQEADREMAVRWEEIEAVQMGNHGYELTPQLWIQTQQETLRLDVGKSTVLPAVVDNAPLQGADKLIRTVTSHAQLEQAGPGSPLYRRPIK